MSDFSGLLMPGSSSLAHATDRYRGLGSAHGGGSGSGGGVGGGGGQRDLPLHLDTQQPLDYSTKKSQGDLLSLASMDMCRDSTLLSENANAAARTIFSQAMAMSSLRSEGHTSALDNSLLSRPGCQPLSMPYSSVPQHATSAFGSAPRAVPAPLYHQPFMPVSPPVPPPTAQMSPLSHPPSHLNSQSAISSLLLAQIQANPLLLTTLLSKTSLTQQQLLQQQLQHHLLQQHHHHHQQQQQQPKASLSPRTTSPVPTADHLRPPSAPISAPLSSFPGLGEAGLGLLQPKPSYSTEHLAPPPGNPYGSNKEEIKLMERSNEEFQHFRDTFLVEAAKLKLRRGGRRSYTPTANAPDGDSGGGGAATTTINGGNSDSSRVSENGNEHMYTNNEHRVDAMRINGDDGELSTTEHNNNNSYNNYNNNNNNNDMSLKNDNMTTCEERHVQEAGQDAFGLAALAPPYALKRRGSKQQQGDNGPKDQAYWERRRKNNEAAKRSRDARRAKEEEIAIRGAFLEQENMKLRAELSTLKSETAKLRCLLYNS